MANIISTGGEGRLEMDIKVQWSKMVIMECQVCCGVIREGVWVFFSYRGGIGMWMVEMDYVYRSKCETANTNPYCNLTQNIFQRINTRIA